MCTLLSDTFLKNHLLRERFCQMQCPAVLVFIDWLNSMFIWNWSQFQLWNIFPLNSKANTKKHINIIENQKVDKSVVSVRKHIIHCVNNYKQIGRKWESIGQGKLSLHMVYWAHWLNSISVAQTHLPLLIVTGQTMSNERSK